MGSIGVKVGRQAFAELAASSGEFIDGTPGVGDVKKVYWTYQQLIQLPGAWGGDVGGETDIFEA